MAQKAWLKAQRIPYSLSQLATFPINESVDASQLLEAAYSVHTYRSLSALESEWREREHVIQFLTEVRAQCAAHRNDASQRRSATMHRNDAA